MIKLYFFLHSSLLHQACMEFRIRELDVDIIPPSTQTFQRPDQGGSKIVVIGKPGCFAKGTKVRMFPSSTITTTENEREKERSRKCIEDIQEGDQVIGMNGQSCTVRERCYGKDAMYRIHYTRTDGFQGSVIVNKRHMLTLWDQFQFCVIDLPLTFFLRYPDQVRMYSWVCFPTIPSSPPCFSSRQHCFCVWSIEFVCEEDEYFGFSIDDERFLLEDGSLVHNTGKTTLITSLLYEKSHIFPVGTVMSGTEDSNGHYRKLFPSTFVYNQLEEKRIEDFITRQKIAKLHVSNPWAILLLDDCTDDPKVLAKPLFQSLYKNGRHWKLLFILSLQYCMDVKPVIRTNIDGTFILRESSLRNRKVLWENYAGIIPDFTTFNAIMDQITDNYTALYIHNATQSNKIEDCVFWYRAKPIPSNFRFGSPDFWKFHKQRYDEHYRDPFLV